MRKVLESCPTCGEGLIISEMSCQTCHTVIQSQYTPCPFCQLAAEDLAFMSIFVKNRGNVKEMERDLGVSYWTIRSRLNEVIEKMGFEVSGEELEPARQELPNKRRDILERLDREEITVAEASELLSALN